MASIPITGVPSTWKVSGNYAEVIFAQGAATASAGEREVVLAMPMLSTGAWTAATLYEIKNEQDAIDGAGAGSPLHRAARRFLRCNKYAKLWGLPVAETSAGAPAKADLTVTWTTNPTASGTTTLWICGEPCSVSFDSNSTPTTIAAEMEEVVDAKTHLPVVSTAAAGVLTLEAKLNGISQGDGTTGAIRVHVEIDLGCTTTVATENGGTTDALGLGTGTTGAEGTTTEAANLATALATLDAVRKYYIVTSAWDATSLGNVVTHISSKSEPIPGLRSFGIGAYFGTLANGQTLATGRNYERLSIAFQPNGEDDPASLAANLAAVRHKHESTDSTYNFDNYRFSGDWLVPAAYAEADWPTDDDLNDAITDGLTPIGSDGVGSYLAWSATTRSKDSSGTTDDSRALETHRISGADYWTDTLLLRDTLNYSGKKLMSDELDAAGNVDPNQRHFRGVVRPSTYKPFVLGLLDEFEGTVLQDVTASKESCQVVRDPNNGGRLEIGVDLNIVDLLHQRTFRLAETNSG
jgi:phage tail sheath gpL-like